MQHCRSPEDFPISKDIAGVNMRLTAGGIRELHWHNAAGWALSIPGIFRQRPVLPQRM
jgi:oxalate decarboxylase